MSEPSPSPLRVGVLFSERTDLLDCLSDLAVTDSRVALVAAATDRHHASAMSSDLPVCEFPSVRYRDRVERDVALADWFVSHHAGLVVCAGWLWLLSRQFLDRFPNRVLNVHPTLLPAFPGRHSVEAAVAYGVWVHGVTVHLVDAGVDTGPIVAQTALHLPVRATASAVRAALAPIERQQLRDVVQAFAHGRAERDAR